MTILYFSAPWCTPCQTFGPRLERIVANFGDVILEKISIDSNMQMAYNYQITNIPALAKKGDQSFPKLIGDAGEIEIQAWIDAARKEV